MPTSAAYVLRADEAEARSVAAAGQLLQRGLNPGDRVAMSAPEPQLAPATAAQAQAALACAAFGALRAGITPVMLNPLLTPDESADYLSDVAASAHVWRASELLELTDPTSSRRNPQLSELPLGRPMHFTSGTTGRSKGVWSGVFDEETAAAYWADEHAAWPVEPGDLLLNHGPLAHSAPLRFSFLAFLHGADVAYLGSFDASRVAQAVADLRPTVAMAAPTHLQRLLDLPGGPPASSYRMLVHAGSACPPDLKRRIHRWAGAEQVWEFLGSTEGQFTKCSGTEWEQRPGTLGRARTGRILTIAPSSPDSSEVPDANAADSPGVIWCQAPSFARFSYFGDAEKTAAACTDVAGGVRFTVGDLGYLDDEGYLFLKGRRTDLIITGGVNVYPSEVEAELRRCPDVIDVAVYGEPDPTWGERVCAAIVAETSPETIAAWCAEHMASYRRPKRFHMVTALPLTSNGKVLRDGLAEWVRGVTHLTSP